MNTLYTLTGIDALHTLGAGNYFAFDAAGFEAHGAGVLAGRITIDAGFDAAAVKTHHHRALIAHPQKALGNANRANVLAKQVTCEGEFDHKQGGEHGKKQHLVSCEFCVDQV